MATFTVWKFDSAGGAEGALETLKRLQKEELADELGHLRGHVELIHTNLSDEQEQKLRDAFGEE